VPTHKVVKTLSEEAKQFTGEDKLHLAIALSRKVRIMKHESMNATLLAKRMNELAGHDVGFRQGRRGCTVLPKVHICGVEVTTATDTLIINVKDDPSGQMLNPPLLCKFEDLQRMR
jgi:hypothetical protein